MQRKTKGRALFAVCLLLVAGGAGAVIGVPEYLARHGAATAGTCLEVESRDRLCRFIGGPLQMSGEPVFIENYHHAFLPTKAKIDFIDASGDKWTAPPQTLTDGATIPVIFAPLIGDRQSREYLMAAALHDAYCGVGNETLETYRTRTWREVHRMFYEALLVNGTPAKKAKIMYAAVFLGGPRWDEPEMSLADVPEAKLLQEMEWCLEWIELADPSPDEIEQWMEDRTQILLSGGPQTMPDYLKEASDPRKF
ncbi:DUF1353 domain-containing protein [Mameliella sediminis]|uniref:DUF1353 domain-containing protein n=1 Tax=Mameliella sediminis TaxID=2836866 RepID=UPI001C46C20B|nr:DUF1353 domain-containing protein [Mameliella sediminis]MBY6117035.1 DUF1353 domain-containing protein [Antarctobacter heliothermus]MBY6146788.1 DUF1353 domain-containing protein [Mameliella alba]MBV7396329.1 DUF1353 domain-containing protein [Mameliella sediminis]MBY6160741.1 DUF1353 domain-containing protein [Mameliella alba]MBY6169211.1 DUF1353 domain-containing protein [Mameliella alba]